MGKSVKTYIERIVNDLDCSPKEKQELVEELSGHLSMLVEDFQNQGFDREKAIELGIREFGNPETIKEGLQDSLLPAKNLLHKIGLLSFAVYSAVVLWQLIVLRIIDRMINGVMFNRFFFIPEGSNGFFSAEVWKLNTNIVPFKSTYTYIAGAQNYNLDIIIQNTIGNILIFIPLGFFLVMLFRRFNTLGKVATAGFVLTVSVEMTQFFLQIGQFDIDDIILNTTGAILGFVIFKFFSKAYKRTKLTMTKEFIN